MAHSNRNVSPLPATAPYDRLCPRLLSDPGRLIAGTRLLRLAPVKMTMETKPSRQ